MATSFFVSLMLQFYFKLSSDNPRDFAWIVIITVACSTTVWLAVTLMTASEKKETLLSFYRRVRPSAALWGPIASEAADVIPSHDAFFNFLDWISGCVLVYMTLFGVGKIIFGQTGTGMVFLVIAAAAGYVIYWDLNRRGWKTVLE